MIDEDELIARYIEPHPQYPGLDEARLKQYGVSVWALVAFRNTVDCDLARVAQAYSLPQEAVEAAFAYYQRYRILIDAQIATNSLRFER